MRLKAKEKPLCKDLEEDHSGKQNPEVAEACIVLGKGGRLVRLENSE